MTRIGVTGHQRLPENAVGYITAHVLQVVQNHSAPVIAVSSLAEGADQLVARLILKVGGRLHAVIPSKNYESTFDNDARREYSRLLGEASETTHLLFPEPSENAYDAAGKWVVEHSDLLIAVWDGLPARGLGGTADAVEHARTLSKDIHVIWPSGTRR